LTPSPAAVLPLAQFNTQEWQAQAYSLGHLELLHHFESRAFEANMLPLPISVRMVIMQCALTTPYLMDQILALSAAHMSTIRHEQQHMFRNQAIELQTRALSLFNRFETGISKKNSCSWFLYASFLGVQVMFETFQSNNFDSFLDKLSTYFPVHQGVHTVVHTAWPAVRGIIEEIVGQRYILDSLKLVYEQPQECGQLNSLIDNCSLEEIDKHACFQAIEILQWIYDLYHTDPRTHIQVPFTVSWSILVPARFGEMLTKRIPEALIILSFYAVLLHRLHNFWVFGSSGRFLIESITDYLGPTWKQWLIWPNQQLVAI
jgi:hypothetical protein